MHFRFLPRLEKRMSAEETRMCIVGSLQNDKNLIEAAQSFNVPIVCSDDGSEYMDDDTFDTGYVLTEFDGDVYNKLRKAEMRIWGPTAILQLVQKEQSLPFNVRPLYCTAMQNLIICFTGFRKKEELSMLVNLVHHMGGSIRKEISAKVTHLVAKSSNNEKYKYAVTLGTQVMSSDWILQSWERRDDVTFCATDESLTKFKAMPFFSCNICFIGFSSDEEKDVNELTKQNGGKLVPCEHEACTHIVIEAETTPVTSENFNPKAYKVKPEWFWASIQMDACADESLYLYQQVVDSPQSAKTAALTPSSRLRNNKRKRLKETLGQLALLPEVESTNKRLSTDLCSSMNASFLDATASPDKTLAETPDKRKTLSPSSRIKSPIEIKSLTARHQVCMELMQTEMNYVNILNTIMKLFREPLESADQVGGPLLDPTEVKIIFGHLPPIFEVHSKLCHDLSELLNDWHEECSISSVILRHSQDLLKAYPPFVNFFEKTKEMLVECDQTKPRFHAFLKICQSKPECGRQTLVELMIRPVQRLPSVILLLNDILKNTSKNNPDHQYLDDAIKSLKEVLTNINEDKRKTEGQVAMFDIVNDIENCPPNLLSSHRSFVSRADMIELSNSLSGKGDTLAMFLFTDSLEVCKRRTKAGSLKSPTTSRNQTKCFKHLELMSLGHIKRVVDIKETGECKQVFALICRSSEEMKEKLFTFAMIGPEGNKLQFLRILCQHIANTVCRPDVDSFLTSLEPHQLDIETSEITTSSLSKAMSRFASKTKKVGRAFSFNRTPRMMKRAVSTMMSPLTDSTTPCKTLPRNHQFYPNQYPSASVANLQTLDSASVAHSYKFSKKTQSRSYGPSSAKLL